MKWLIILLLLSTASLFAQDYKPELEGKLLPAKIIFGDGVVYDILMKYQQPEMYKNPQNKFTISKGTEQDAYDHTGGIEAFIIDNKVWAMRPVKGQAQFVILKIQGAIEQYEYVINGKVGETKSANYVVMGDRTKLITRNTLTNELIEGEPNGEIVKKWISDSPESLEDLRLAEEEANAMKSSMSTGSKTLPAQPAKKGLMGALERTAAKDAEMKREAATTVDYNRIINNYNLGYEQRNPGKIKYYFAPSMTWVQLPTRPKTIEERKAESKAKLDNAFAGRSMVVAQEVASAKSNEPVKKETFVAKMQRIKSDGNKVGVLIRVEPVRVAEPNATSTLSQDVKVEGEYMDDSYYSLGSEFVKELNESLGTTDIELIDINKIPYREARVLGQQVRLDDWWATKYKIVFSYNLDPRIRITMNESKYNVALNMISSLIVTEYIGDTTSTKQDIITQILNFGSFLSPPYTQEEVVTDIKAAYQKSLERLGMPVLEKVNAERSNEVKKLVEKRLSK